MTTHVQNNKIEHFLGRGNMPCYRLIHPLGGEVVVSEYGAQVLSWVTPEGREVLFLSEKACFENGKAIRGGIPIIFPQFNQRGTLPRHGFARTKRWQAVRQALSNEDAVSVTFRLTADSATRAIWPHEFLLELDIILSDVLMLALRVENIGEAPFSYTNALHTYFRIQDIATTCITGLQGVQVEDFLDGNARFIEERERVFFDGAVDRVYSGSSQIMAIIDESVPLKHTLVKEGFPDAVVWNPWSEGARQLSDLSDDEYTAMICVESGCVVQPKTVEPGSVHVHAQIMRVVE